MNIRANNKEKIKCGQKFTRLWYARNAERLKMYKKGFILTKNHLDITALCPCQSGFTYGECCQPWHKGKNPPFAEQLMRSRYSAFVLQDVDYIVNTTTPQQQKLLDKKALLAWAATTQWVGLEIVQTQKLPLINHVREHSLVEFNAFFIQECETHTHHENSLFVQIEGRWYFIDPTVPLPAMKQRCLCGSDKKFKHCCGGFLCA